MEPKVHVVVLNWNGWSDTSACLSSLQRLNYRDFRVVVVDNGSTDDSVSRIRRQFPEVALIETGKNLGFAAGCNVGMAHSLAQRTDYIWLLNNDTTVHPAALQALVDVAESDRRTGAVGSAIYSADNPQRLEAWGGGCVNFWLGRSRHFLQPVSDKKIHFITGASFLLSRTVVESQGFFDERFFMYWEDADYCFRLRRSGWGLAVAGESKVWHKGSASVGNRSALMDTYFNASAARFFQKHSWVPAVPLCTGVGLRLAKRALAGDWDKVRAVWAGASGAWAAGR